MSTEAACILAGSKCSQSDRPHQPTTAGLQEEVSSSIVGRNHLSGSAYHEQQQQQASTIDSTHGPAVFDSMTGVAAADVSSIEERMKHAKAILYLQNLMGVVSQQNSQASASIQVLPAENTIAPSIQAMSQSQVGSQCSSTSGLCSYLASKTRMSNY